MERRLYLAELSHMFQIPEGGEAALELHLSNSLCSLQTCLTMLPIETDLLGMCILKRKLSSLSEIK